MFSKLFKPKWQHPAADVRISAVAELSTAEAEQRGILALLAGSDPNPGVRQAAAAKVVELDTLMTVSGSDTEQAVRTVAKDRLCEVLAGNTDSGPGLAERIEALKSLHDPTTLQHIVHHGADRIRDAALDLLADESLLEDIAVNCHRAKLRAAAAERLSLPDPLERVARQSSKKDKSVYKIVRGKLSEQRRLQKAGEQRTQRLNALCEAMERLEHSEYIPHYAAKRNLLWTEWAALDPDPASPVARRFIAANQACVAKAQSLQSDLSTRKEAAAKQLLADQAERAAVDELLDYAQRCRQTPAETEADLAELEETLALKHAAWRENVLATVVDADDRARFEQCYQELQRYQRCLRIFSAKKTEIAKLNAKVENLRIPGDMAPIKLLSRKLSKVLGDIDWDHSFKMPAELAAANRSVQRLIELDRKRRDWQQEQLPNFIARLDLLSGAVENGDSKAANRLYKEVDTLGRLLPEKAVAPYRDRLQHLIAEIRKLQDWKSFATTPKKEALCRRMEDLAAEDADPRDKADRIQQLQHEWKQLGGSAGSKELWQRFSAASDLAFEPCRAYFEQLNLQRAQNLVERERVCDQLSCFLQETTWDDPDWALVDQTFLSAKRQWRQLHVYRKEGKATQQRFDDLLAELKRKLDDEWRRNARKKQDLISKIATLSEAEDSRDAIRQTKQLQQEWKTIGKSPGKTDRKLWREFRAACDAVFARRDQMRRDAEEIRNANARQAAEIIEQVTVLAGGSDETLQASRGQYRQLRQSFQDLGALPKASAGKLRGQFDTACEAYLSRFSGIEARRERAELDELKRLALLCQTLEQRILDPEDALDTSELAEIEQSCPPRLVQPDAVADPISQRLTTAIRAARENKPEALRQNLGANLEALQKICIQLEILADVETPEAYKKARMEYQVKRLSKGLGQRHHDERPRQQQARELERRWYGIGPVDADNTEALERRFRNALSALAGP